MTASSKSTRSQKPKIKCQNIKFKNLNLKITIVNKFEYESKVTKNAYL